MDANRRESYFIGSDKGDEVNKVKVFWEDTEEPSSREQDELYAELRKDEGSAKHVSKEMNGFSE